MCGRFLGPNKLKALAVFQAIAREGWAPDERIHYNTAPTQTVLGIVQQHRRIGEPMSWGWRPAFLRGGLLVNGKSETAPFKPTFATAFREQRCVVPAGGFYEWKTVGSGKAATKLPYLFRIRDADICGIAALYDDELVGETWHRRMILLTAPANELVAPVHERMAVLLDARGVETWLDPDATQEDLLAVCRPFPAERMEAVPVSPLLNHVKNDGPEVLQAPPTSASA